MAISRVGLIAPAILSPVQARVGREAYPTWRRRGSALLTVLWISAALAALGFALANTVRSETERASTTVDELRSYYLASGAVERAAIEVLWSAVNPSDPKLPKGTTRVNYAFLTGVAHVEIIPEASKLDINNISPENLARLLEGLGAPGPRIAAVVAGVMGWRAGRAGAFSSLGGHAAAVGSRRAASCDFAKWVPGFRDWRTVCPYPAGDD